MKLEIYSSDKKRKLILAQSREEEGNMSFARGGAEEVIANRRRFLGRFDLRLENLTAAGLVHGKKCAIITLSDMGRGAFTLDDAIYETDALVTSEKNLILAVTTADCLPLFIWDDNLTVVGIAHAGWKGLAEGVLKNLVGEIKGIYFGSLFNLRALIGVGIGECCYTVDTGRLKKFFGYGLCHIHHREGEAVHLNLRNIARIQLQREGMPEENIHIEAECSSCGGNYPSYRRRGEDFITDLAFITVGE